MIREWCPSCGTRLGDDDKYVKTRDNDKSPFCLNCEFSVDWTTIGEARLSAGTEAFWTAIAHERARTERLAAVFTLSAMLSEEIVALASLDAVDRADPKRFDEVRAEAMRLVDLIQTEVGK